MATAMMSLNVAAAAVPVASCAVSGRSDCAVHMSSSASFGGMRLDSAIAAAPSVSRSSRPFVVRAGQKPNFWESLTSAFGAGKKKVADASTEAEKELNKASGEAQKSSGDLGDKAESFKGEVQAKADEASKEVKAGVEDLNKKVEEAVEAAQKQ